MLLIDLRYALRQSKNTPGFTVTAVLTPALGVGATAAIFTLVTAVLMRNLPVTDPKSLVRLVVLLVTALIAGLIPASRAASIDPVRALRAE